MKRLLAAIAAALLITSLVSNAVAAAPAAFTHATGSVWLSGPSQLVAFNAVDYGTGVDRGTVNYTNFEYAAPGSGAWLPVAGTYALTTALGGSPYAHTMVIDIVTINSPADVSFSGTGFYNADPSYTWTVTGSIVEGVVSFHIVYTGTAAGYTFDATGAAATMSGTGTDSLGQTPLTWVLPAGFAHEVLSYAAAVTCATVNTAHDTMSFGFTIPAGFPGLTGLPIYVVAYDGGTPGMNGDTFGFTVASCAGGAVANYPIVGGNLVVH
jgi:hypothetical protein